MKLPLQAMEEVVRRADAEGLVDRERIGISGLSYGSEIVEYAIAHSTLFRAAASAAPGLADPLNRWLLPMRRAGER